MRALRDNHLRTLLAMSLVGLAGGGCGVSPVVGDLTTGSLKTAKVVEAPTLADKECLERAMYFESQRSDEEGLLAVGTVVMNRLDAPAYPGRICDVVGQKRQFAAGVLSKPVRDADKPRIEKVASLLLAGERHPEVGQALHFHTAGRTYPYDNMHYVATAGGNTFYEKSDREGYLPAPVPHAVVRTATGTLVPVQVAALSDGALTGSAAEFASPAAASVGQPVAVAAAPVLPAQVRTSYSAMTYGAMPGRRTTRPAKDICLVADASLD